MKKLYYLNEEEKERILNMHRNASQKHYLRENKSKIFEERDLILESTPKTIKEKIRDIFWWISKRMLPIRDEPRFKTKLFGKNRGQKRLSLTQKTKETVLNQLSDFFTNNNLKSNSGKIYFVKKSNLTYKQLYENQVKDLEALASTTDDPAQAASLTKVINRIKTTLLGGYKYKNVTNNEEIYVLDGSKLYDEIKQNPDNYEFIENIKANEELLLNNPYIMDISYNFNTINDILTKKSMGENLSPNEIEFLNKLKTEEIWAGYDSENGFKMIEYGGNRYMNDPRGRSYSAQGILQNIDYVRPRGLRNSFLYRWAHGSPMAAIITYATFFVGGASGLKLVEWAAGGLIKTGLRNWARYLGFTIPTDLDTGLKDSCSKMFKNLAVDEGEVKKTIETIKILAKDTNDKYNQELKLALNNNTNTIENICKCADALIFQEVYDISVNKMIVVKNHIDEKMKLEVAQKEKEKSMIRAIENFEKSEQNLTVKVKNYENVPPIKMTGGDLINFGGLVDCPIEHKYALASGDYELIFFPSTQLIKGKDDEPAKWVGRINWKYSILIYQMDGKKYYKCKEVTGNTSEAEKIQQEFKNFIENNNWTNENLNQGKEKLDDYKKQFEAALGIR